MEIQGKKYTIGADPEVFVGRGDTFISAHGLVSGTKDNPFPVNKGAVQVDGLALEYNIDPASSPEEFENNLLTVQEQLKGMVGDLDFLETPSVFFDEEFLKNIPFENLILGCEPDFNAYNLSPNPRPDGGALMRTAGGHVHVGGFYTDNPRSPLQMGMSAYLARLMDRYLGVYSILWDKDDNRRSMYGKAGSFRPKPYGMEYRSMSNKWTFNKGLIRFVYNGVEKALKQMFDGEEVEEEFSSGTIRDIINNSDRTHPFFHKNRVAEEVYDLVGA